MAPSKHYKLNLVLNIIDLYHEAGQTNWERLANDIYRFMNNDIPTNNGLTEQFHYIAENFLGISPQNLEIMSSSIRSDCFICLKILKSLNVEYLHSCQKFLIGIYNY